MNGIKGHRSVKCFQKIYDMCLCATARGQLNLYLFLLDSQNDSHRSISNWFRRGTCRRFSPSYQYNHVALMIAGNADKMCVGPHKYSISKQTNVIEEVIPHGEGRLEVEVVRSRSTGQCPFKMSSIRRSQEPRKTSNK